MNNHLHIEDVTKAYPEVVEQLVSRITALVPEHSEILKMKDPFGLFKISGFKCDDLQPSLAQGQKALRAVQEANNPKP